MIRRMLTRRHFLTTSTAALAAGVFWRVDLGAQGRQGQPQPVTPVTKEIRRNVGFFTGRGGTIGWLINPAGVIVVESNPAMRPAAPSSEPAALIAG